LAASTATHTADVAAPHLMGPISPGSMGDPDGDTYGLLDSDEAAGTSDSVQTSLEAIGANRPDTNATADYGNSTSLQYNANSRVQSAARDQQGDSYATNDYRTPSGQSDGAEYGSYSMPNTGDYAAPSGQSDSAEYGNYSTLNTGEYRVPADRSE